MTCALPVVRCTYRPRRTIRCPHLPTRCTRAAASLSRPPNPRLHARLFQLPPHQPSVFVPPLRRLWEESHLPPKIYVSAFTLGYEKLFPSGWVGEVFGFLPERRGRSTTCRHWDKYRGDEVDTERNAAGMERKWLKGNRVTGTTPSSPTTSRRISPSSPT
jgi:hypothetical protein